MQVPAPPGMQVPAAPPALPVDGAALGAELSTAVILFHEAIGHRLGLSAADQRALGIIGGRGPMTAGTLAQLTGLSPGAVTGLVDRLERGGHVTRSADPGDRRRIVITAVPSPGAGVGEAFARLNAEMTALVSRYDAKESAAILDYLHATIAILREQTRLLSDQPLG
jgi:DNA-binding MarR family transcriptional regulator